MFGVYDCTGHGVPGAFITSLAEHALDAGMAASRHEIKNPNRAGEILSHVYDFIRTVVNADSLTSSNDGMDAFLLDFRPGEKVTTLRQISMFLCNCGVSKNLKVMR